MSDDKPEGQDPAARRAAEEWRRRFGREGHEGSYARHEEDGDGEAVPSEKAEPNGTSE